MSDIFSIFPGESFVDLGLLQFGREQCKPSKSFGPVARNHFLFHYIISGRGELMYINRKGENKSCKLDNRQGFMLYPRQISTYIADFNDPWEYVWLEFDGLRIHSMLGAAGLTEDTPIYSARSSELREKMSGEMIYIAEHSSASPYHLIGHLYLFFDYLIRSVSPARTTEHSRLRDYYVHEAIVFIEHNFSRDITIEDIAGVCGLNRSYFGKIFKEALGKSPQEFLVAYRMAKAVELLRLTQMPVGDIGAAVGYENPLHFSRAFKHVYGISPRKWKAEYQSRK